MSVKIGDVIRLTGDAVENYGPEFRGRDLRVVGVAFRQGTAVGEHPGYDESVSGQALVDTVYADTGAEVPFSVYEYEFKVRG